MSVGPLIVVDAVLACLVLGHVARSRDGARTPVRRRLFLVVYHGILPVGYAQAWLARTFRRAGIGVGWPLLVVWWPLRRLYTLGFRLCYALRS
jgi:hypothetical protein